MLVYRTLTHHVSSALAVVQVAHNLLTKQATDSGMGTETQHLKQSWWHVLEQKGFVHEFHTSVKGTNIVPIMPNTREIKLYLFRGSRETCKTQLRTQEGHQVVWGSLINVSQNIVCGPIKIILLWCCTASNNLFVCNPAEHSVNELCVLKPMILCSAQQSFYPLSKFYCHCL